MSQSGPQWEKEMEWDRINTYIKTHGPTNINKYKHKYSKHKNGSSNSKSKSKRKHKYSMKKKRGGAGKRKRSDSNEPSEPNSEEMKNALRRQAAIRLQRITRGRQLRQKRKLTRKNIGKRETIYTPHKKCYRDLTWKEKLEIIRRYYELTKQLKDDDDMAKYLFPLYFPCEKHYTSIPIPISFQNLLLQMESDDSSSEPYAQNLQQQIALEQINDD